MVNKLGRVVALGYGLPNYIELLLTAKGSHDYLMSRGKIKTLHSRVSPFLRL